MSRIHGMQLELRLHVRKWVARAKGVYPCSRRHNAIAHIHILYKQPCAALRLTATRSCSTSNLQKPLVSRMHRVCCILILSNLIQMSAKVTKLNFCVSEFYQLCIIRSLMEWIIGLRYCIYRAPVCKVAIKINVYSLSKNDSSELGCLYWDMGFSHMIYCDSSSDTAQAHKRRGWLAALNSRCCIPWTIYQLIIIIDLEPQQSLAALFSVM